MLGVDRFSLSQLEEKFFMSLCYRPSGAMPRVAATATATIVAVTIAVLTTPLPGHAQVPGSDTPAQTNADVTPPPGEPPPSTIGQGPPPATTTPPPAVTTTPPPAATTTPPPPPGHAPPPRHITNPRTPGSTQVVAKVNLRSDPGTESEIIASIPAGATVHVNECDGEWCSVTWNGRNGFVIARNLNLGPTRQAGGYPPPGGRDYPPPRAGDYPPPGAGEYPPPGPNDPPQDGDEYPPPGPGYEGPGYQGPPPGRPGADYPPGAYGPAGGYTPPTADYYTPPAVAYGPGYYYRPYGPRYYYYGRPYWRRHWW